MRTLVILLLVLLCGGGAYLALFESTGTSDERDESSADPGEEGGEGTGTVAPADLHGSPHRQVVADEGGRGRTAVPTQRIKLAAREAETEAPIENFSFRIESAVGAVIARGDANGAHEMALPVGEYRVLAELEGWHASPLTVELVAATSVTEIIVEMQRVAALLSLEILDQGSSQRLVDFRITVLYFTADGKLSNTRFLKPSSDNPRAISAERDQSIEVIVEAEGYTPAAPLKIDFADDPQPTRQVFLSPVMRFSGVELRMTDSTSRPVPNLEVHMERKGENGEFKTLWRRSKTDHAGIFKLPDLAAGAYRLRAQAIDDKGTPTLQLPVEMKFEIAGSEHVLEHFQLKDGGSIQLTVTDTQGRVLGSDVAIEVTRHGKSVDALWRPLVDGRPDPTAPLADHLTRAAPARLVTALEPGRVELVLRRRQRPIIRRTLFLRAGELSEITVPLNR